MASKGGIVHTLANVGEEVLKVNYLFANSPRPPSPPGSPDFGAGTSEVR